MSTKQRTRHAGLDLVKAIAIFGVLLIHSASPGYSAPVMSPHWIGSVFWGCILRSSVPLFLMCSGALFLDPERELSTGHLYRRNIMRILASMFVWAMLYKIYDLFMGNALTLANLIQAFKEVLLFQQEFHLYYLHIILLVYATVPVMRVFTRHCTRRELEYALGLWFLTGIVYPTVRYQWPFSLITGIPVQWMLNMSYASIGYGLLGYYLRRYPLHWKAGLVLLLSGTGIVFGGTLWFSAKNGFLYEALLEGMSVGVFLQACGIFTLCLDLGSKLPTHLNRVVTYFSGASFCIYLTHSFFLRILPQHGIHANMCFSLLAIPASALCNLALCCLVYEGLKRLPLVKRWLL